MKLKLEEETLSVNLHLPPLKDRKQQTLGFVLVVDDITQEERMMSTLSRYVSREEADALETAVAR